MMSKKMRRSGRLFKSVPILLIASDAEGRMFWEDTHTVILSLHGAGIVSNNKLIAEQELILRSKETNLEAEIRIVSEIGSEDGGGAVFAGVPERAGDLCGGEGDEYFRIAGTENVPVRGGVFASGGDADAHLK